MAGYRNHAAIPRTLLEGEDRHSQRVQGFHILEVDGRLESHIRSLQALGAEGLRNHANGHYSLPEAAFQDGAIVSARYVGRRTSIAAPVVPIRRSSQAEEAGGRDLDASTGTTFSVFDLVATRIIFERRNFFCSFLKKRRKKKARVPAARVTKNGNTEKEDK